MWAGVFAATNLIAVAGWLALIAGHRNARVQEGVLYVAIGLLSLAYLVVFVALFGGLADPVREPGAPAPSLSDYSVTGLRVLFQSDGAIVLGWTHYLAFDLFVGLWIVRDGAAWLGRLALLPFLFATFMAGPIGLLAWLASRGVVHSRTPAGT